MISFVRNSSVRRNYPRTTDRMLDGISGLGYPQDNRIAKRALTSASVADSFFKMLSQDKVFADSKTDHWFIHTLTAST